MTCKNCIHNCVCSLWRREEGQDAKFYAETEDGKCEHFADKSRFVELPTLPDNAEHCVVCGTVIPEGLQVCFECMEALT